MYAFVKTNILQIISLTFLYMTLWFDQSDKFLKAAQGYKIMNHLSTITHQSKDF